MNRIRKTMRHGLRNAFTLIELLVVVAIIVVLIAILLPSLGLSRKQAQMVACQSNLRQLAMIAQMYSEENSQFMPAFYVNGSNGPYDWFSSLGTMISPGFAGTDSGRNKLKVYLCPSGSYEWDVNTSTKYWWTWRPTSYAISYYSSAYLLADHFSKYDYIKANIWEPSSFVLFGDSQVTGMNTPQGNGYGFYLSRSTGLTNMTRSLAMRHGSGDNPYVQRASPARMNAAFLDGHIELLSAEQFIVKNLSVENGSRCPISNSTGIVSDVFP